MQQKPSVLLTGALGFLGSGIAHRLRNNYNVYGVDDLSYGSRKNEVEGVVYEIGCFSKLTKSFLSKFDVLIHAATVNIIAAMDEPERTKTVNCDYTKELFGNFHGKIIYLSTTSVYGNAATFPTKEHEETYCGEAYSMSKLIAEKWLNKMHHNYTVLRLSNVFGFNQRPENPCCGVVSKIISQILNDEEVLVYGDGTQTRDYTFVEDVVDAVMLAIKFPAQNRVINIATAQETSVVKLATTIGLLCGKATKINFVDRRRIDTINRRCVSNALAQELLGWHPTTTLEEGLSKTIEWIKQLK